jgi:hypothetical protein
MKKHEFKHRFGRNCGRYNHVNEETQQIQVGRVECERGGFLCRFRLAANDSLLEGGSMVD